jgi:hypothetical protein
VTTSREGRSDGHLVESQLAELQNVRVLLEEARGLSRNLAYHRRALLESRIGEVLEGVDQQTEELRAARGLELCPHSRIMNTTDMAMAHPSTANKKNGIARRTPFVALRSPFRRFWVSG